jgi:parallel beta-helix repeat protein
VPRRALLAALIALVIVAGFGSAPQKALAATVLNVPADFPTIQAAITAASPGDTVLVAAGTYNENIDFQSKAITVRSASGAASTIINGTGQTVVVKMDANPGQTPVLDGFTVRGGGGQVPEGGISTAGGPALIENNIVTANHFCDEGAIDASSSAATIRNNVITNNSQALCSGGIGGAGIAVLAAGTVQILNNVISGNSSTGFAGGISLFAAGTPTVSGNTISNNAGNFGGGIGVVNFSNATIVNNVIFGNHATSGGGIYANSSAGPSVTNNTIAANDASTGSAVYMGGFGSQVSFVNNILTGGGATETVYCASFPVQTPAIFQFNDVWNSGTGARYAGACSDQTGVNGNVGGTSLFVNAAGGNYHLRAGAAIDAGTSSGAPTVDIDGDVRPLDGNADGFAFTDVGADEITQPFVDTTPPTISCNASPSALAPPNHSLNGINVAISANDDSGAPAVTLVSAASSQPDAGLDPSDVSNDIQGFTTGADDRSGFLRAEAFGGTRTYALTYQAADFSGNTATCQTTVTVAPDSTPPVANPTQTPPAGPSGWTIGNVTVDWNWTDTGSGIDPGHCDQSSTVVDTGTTTVSATCTDLAGNHATASYTVNIVRTVLTMGPQAMEGNLRVAPGSLLRAGYDFSMPGAHAGATLSFVGGQVSFNVTCADGSAAGSIVVPLADTSYSDPAGSSARLPANPAYEGQIAVPDLCNGGLVSLKAGGTFTTGIVSSDTNDKVNVRWHYSDGSAGGWSATQSVVPR